MQLSEVLHVILRSVCSPEVLHFIKIHSVGFLNLQKPQTVPQPHTRKIDEDPQKGSGSQKCQQFENAGQRVATEKALLLGSQLELRRHSM